MSRELDGVASGNWFTGMTLLNRSGTHWALLGLELSGGARYGGKNGFGWGGILQMCLEYGQLD